MTNPVIKALETISLIISLELKTNFVNKGA